jgi:hypothetical protein
MEPVIIDPLPFSLAAPGIVQALRVRPGSSREAEVYRLIAEAQAIARPKVIYQLAFIEDKGDNTIVANGHTFTSRILRVNLDGLHRAFAYVCTSGRELEAWVQAQGDMLAQYYADSINEAVLHSATLNFIQQLSATFGLGQTAAMNPGSLADWPISQQRVLFSLLGGVQAAIGVELTPSMLMLPAKSVSGILFPTEANFASCQLCPRSACPNRRMPFEPDLFEQKYSVGQAE